MNRKNENRLNLAALSFLSSAVRVLDLLARVAKGVHPIVGRVHPNLSQLIVNQQLHHPSPLALRVHSGVVHPDTCNMDEETDDRPLIKDLLHEHACDLAELGVILEKETSYSKQHYDDNWMLRFLLSHKSVKKASAAATPTMQFRKERNLNELGDIRHKLLDHFEHNSDRYFDIAIGST